MKTDMLSDFGRSASRALAALAVCFGASAWASPVLITPGSSAGYLYYGAASASSTTPQCNDAKAKTWLPGTNCMTGVNGDELAKFVSIYKNSKLIVKISDESGLKAASTMACTGSGWGVPTLDQLRLLFAAKKELGGFGGALYLSLDNSVAGSLVFQGSSKGMKIPVTDTNSSLYSLRCVKTV